MAIRGCENITKHFIFIKTFIPLLLILTFIFCIGTVSASKEIYVNTTGNDTTGTGTANNPYLTIQKGVDNLDPNGVIKIANGQYSGANNTNITINKNMNIIGQSHTKTVINGKDTDWLFKILPGVKVKLSNLKLTNGYISGNGGAIQNEGILTLTNCYINNNTASGDGGAILNYCMVEESSSGFHACVLNLNNCTLNDNTAGGDGGAISNQCNIKVKDSIMDACVLNLNNCTLKKNIAGSDGGAISNHGIININGSGNGACVLNLNDDILAYNDALGDGGAISNQGIVSIKGSGLGDCVLNISRCILTGNGAIGNGGAVLNLCVVNINGSGLTKTSLNVVECTLTSNIAYGNGGAIWNDGTATMLFNRIFDNIAHRGIAIYADYTMNATDNWWGSNYPDFKSLIYSTKKVKVIYTPWLYLTFTAYPTIIPAGSTSTLKASFNQHTDGTLITPIDPVKGHIPDGTPVIFTTNLGNVGSKSIEKYTIQGLAYVILRGDEGPGIATVSVIADDQTLNTSVDIIPTNPATAQIIGMQKTGIPLSGILLAILLIIGGLIGNWKKE